jgi:hypothetical protein
MTRAAAAFRRNSRLQAACDDAAGAGRAALGAVSLADLLDGS